MAVRARPETFLFDYVSILFIWFHVSDVKASPEQGEAGGPSRRTAEVATVLAAVPEFLDRYLELVRLETTTRAQQQAFCELADFVAELASGVEQYRPVLTRCLAAVEEVASSSDDAEELVGWSFLDYLSLDARRTAAPVARARNPRRPRSDRGPYVAWSAPSTQMTPLGPTVAAWEMPLPSSIRSPGSSSTSWTSPVASRTWNTMLPTMQ